MQISEISSQRLLLRRPCLEDASDVFTYQADPQVTRFLSFEPSTHAGQSLEFLQMCDLAWRRGLRFPLAVTFNSDADSQTVFGVDPDALIGMVEVRPSEFGVELGYVLQRRFWGNGLMSEAVSAVVEHVFDFDDVYRIFAYADVANVASHRVLSNAGLVFEATLHSWLPSSDSAVSPSDAAVYAKWR